MNTKKKNNNQRLIKTRVYGKYLISQPARDFRQIGVSYLLSEIKKKKKENAPLKTQRGGVSERLSSCYPFTVARTPRILLLLLRSVSSRQPPARPPPSNPVGKLCLTFLAGSPRRQRYADKR